jgi:hypothetical protein
MAFTSVPNNPANQLLPYYPTLTTQLTELTQACDPLNGNYFVATGRDLVTFIAKPSSYAPAWLTSTIYTQGQVVNYSGSPFIALANVGLNQGVSPEALSFSITSVAGGTGVYTGTITGGAANAFAGYYFVVTGFSNLPNNGTFVCTASTTTTLTLQNAASVTETPLLPANASSPTGFWTAYTGSTITVYSAPDACTGRTANIVDYPVPVFDSTSEVVEFLVLPGSVFTQANGWVQFLASSNLVYVYVRSL